MNDGIDSDSRPLVEVEDELYAPGAVFDTTDPRSLYNIIPDHLKRAISQVPTELFFESEAVLRRKCKADAFLNRVRLAFWREYEEAQSNVSRMRESVIARSVDLPTVRLRALLSDPKKLPFVLVPPASYENFLEEASSIGLSRLREIIDTPFQDPETGKLDHKAMEIVLKAVAFIDMRRNGGIMQRSMNMHGIVDARGSKAMAKQIKSEDIDRRLQELREKKELMLARQTVGDQAIPNVSIGTMKDIEADFEKL